jgi:hypothetical protein
MKQMLIKAAVRTSFLLSTRTRAAAGIRRWLAHYLALADVLDPPQGRQVVRVPPMLGVDEAMRNWSFFMLLEHNAIVNRSITDIVCSLARGRQPQGPGAMDPKKDVMPALSAGPEQVAAFRASVQEHLAAVAELGRLRGTPVRRHSVFGMLDAHGWHCMFGLHLKVHVRQAETVVRTVRARPAT